MTGIPAVTLRRYSKNYGRFLSRDSQQGRIKYFSDKDIATLGFIRRAFEMQMTAEQIFDRLETGNIELKEGSALMLLPEIREGFTRLTGRQDQTELELQRQAAELERLNQQHRRDRLALWVIALAIVGIFLLFLLTN